MDFFPVFIISGPIGEAEAFLLSFALIFIFETSPIIWSAYGEIVYIIHSMILLQDEFKKYFF